MKDTRIVCDNCDKEIRDGDTMYKIGSERFCEECISNGRIDAEINV